MSRTHHARKPRQPGRPRTYARTRFYVSAIDGERKALICGPYDTHEEALADVARVKAAAERVDARAIWYAWGTASTKLYMHPALGAPHELPSDLEHNGVRFPPWKAKRR